MTVSEILEKVYSEYHNPEYIYPDPLAPVKTYKNASDREVAALVASSLAVGRVELILRAVDQVLRPLGEHPATELKKLKKSDLVKKYAGFVYRFFKTREIAGFLYAIGQALREFGSLEALFLSGYSKGDILSGIEKFCSFLDAESGHSCGMLITPPGNGSACKRFNLFLRWMVRCDAVDPGGWTGVDKKDLLVPVDTHMFDIATRLGFTHRKGGDLRTALEITSGFRQYCPEDPVKYDFSLTRLGIHPDLDKSIFDKLTL